MRVTEPQLAAALAGWRAPGIPLTAGLAAAVREGVLDGRLRAGSTLPAERRLAAVLGVSRGTVIAALAVLRDEGWVETRAGSASTLRLAPAAAGRLAPRSATGENGVIDLRRAVPAAPHARYQAALARAAGRCGALLAEDGDPGPGLPELRALIARRHTEEGLATRPEQILVTSGARSGLALLSQHLRPRSVAVEIPAYFDALHVLRATGARLNGLRVSADGWDVEQLATAFGAARGGLAYLTPDFQNPTGALMDRATRGVVAELAARHRVTVVVDETMRELDLRDDPAPGPRIRGALLIGSTSKTVWGGLRVGWIRGPASLVAELCRGPLAVPLAAAPFEQLVAAELLADGPALLQQRRAALRRQRDHLADLLAGDDRWAFTVPDGGLALWLRLAGGRADELAARARADGLDVSPGSRFAADTTLTRYVRVPFTPPTAVLDRVAAVLDKAAGR
ncbi:PLP-dependent aminotransferase family protein [Streptacidiphilus sp. P02-A3a]|uniref:aminotransferase-like domain-containing protein n=1 Tax=Streptacidiphilus sp. P02-A3a TaxID=2704468 RepID=UPI001CDD3E4E|nr:PLP-dependent aminotransferase family protein [Streptacidiphilus sp. P02-A3a]